MTPLVALQWSAYNSAAQTVSELSGIGAPTRSLWLRLALPYTVLVCAFGWGVWKAAGRHRALRIAGTLILTYGALGLVWPFAPMHLRPALAMGGGTLGDTVHILLGCLTVVLMLLAIGIGAMAFGRPFRLYSIGTILVILVFGVLTGLDAPGIAANRPTPRIGIWERISIGAFLLWLAVLAVVLLRRPEPGTRGTLDGPIGG
jgi:Protein of unknown function (DUF998)